MKVIMMRKEMQRRKKRTCYISK